MRTPKECIDRLIALGMPKAEIARRVGVNRTNITNYSRGACPRYEVADALRVLTQAKEQEIKKLIGKGADL